MQNLVLNRARLVELFRCDRSFVMTLFHHGLTNEYLDESGHAADFSEVSERRNGLMLDTQAMREAISAAGGYQTVECSDNDPWEKVSKTMDLINQGGPLVILDGALASQDCIVGFSALIVREDDMWEVFHLSTKSYDPSSTSASEFSSAYADATPLMYVLATEYADRVARFAVIAADKKYLVPYPDPETRLITVDPDGALFYMDMDLGDDLWNELGGVDPLEHVRRIYDIIAQDPFWIPEATMGAQCNKPYPCAFSTYCRSHMDPDHINFHLENYHDRKKLLANGYLTMHDLLELSYYYPTLEDIPCTENEDKTFTLTEDTLRCLRMYEDSLGRN